MLMSPVYVQGGGDEEDVKRRRQSARGYQKKFHSSHGDAITALNVLCAYEQSPAPEAFCRFAIPFDKGYCPLNNNNIVIYNINNI